MEKLILVYNANSGWHNNVIDSLHKVVSPKTYDCNLCDITFGVFSEKEIWKKFRIESGVEMQFLHKNEFLEVYKLGKEYSFPIIFKKNKNEVIPFLSTEEINRLKEPQDLINLIKTGFK